MPTKTAAKKTQSASKTSAPIKSNEEKRVEFVKVRDLQFDPENPRFFRLNNSSSTNEVLEEMLDKEGVQDLMLSIGEQGYFAGEPLLVVSSNGKAPYVVVEGNRRLAATKLLTGELPPPSRRKASVAQIRAEARVTAFPKGLPCLIYRNRKEVLRYLGYRHITGIKEWDSLSKARYLAQLRDEFYSDEDESRQLKSLANDIGSRSDYVGQLLTALNLYIAAEENKKFFGLPIRAEDVEFSYLTTALNYSSICSWLGLNGRTDIDMPNLRLDNLKRAFGWFFAKDELGRTVLGESRNLAELASIVTSTAAVKVLETSRNIEEAFLHTDGPQKALENAMQQAHDKILTVWRMLPEIQPLQSTHLELAKKLVEDARSIRSTIGTRLEEED